MCLRTVSIVLICALMLSNIFSCPTAYRFTPLSAQSVRGRSSLTGLIHNSLRRQAVPNVQGKSFVSVKERFNKTERAIKMAVIKRIEGLEYEYTSFLNLTDRGFDTSYPAMKKLDKIYERLVKKIDFYLKEKGIKGRFLHPVFQEYKQEIAEIHQENKELLTIYNVLTWPQGMRGERAKNRAYEEMRSDAKYVWGIWGRVSNPPNHIRELLILKSIRDNQTPASTDWRKANGKLIDKVFSVLQLRAAESDTRLHRRFKVILYSNVLTKKLRYAENKEELFWDYLQAVRAKEAPLGQDVRKHIEYLIYGTMGKELVKRTEDRLIDMAVAQMIQDMQRKGLSKIYKTMLLTILGVALAGSLVNQAVDRIKRFKKVPRDSASIVRILKPLLPTESVSFIKERSHKRILSLSLAEILEPLPDGADISNLPVSPELDQKMKKLEEIIARMEKRLEGLESGEGEAGLAGELSRLRVRVGQREQGLKQRGDGLAEIGPVNMKDTREDFFPDPEEWHSPQSKEEMKPPSQRSKGYKGEKTIEGVRFGSSKAGFDAYPWTEGERAFARVKGGNDYLKTGGYSRINPVTGKMFDREPEFEYREPESSSGFSKWVMTRLKGSGEFIVDVPPGYVITGVLTEKPVESVGCYYDRANEVWAIAVSQDPGMVKLGIRLAKKGELPNPYPIEFVNGNGHVLSADQTKQALSAYMPDTLIKILDIAEELAPEEWEEVVRKIFGLFYYTTNPLLNDPEFKGRNFMDTGFKYWVGECQFRSTLKTSFSYMRDDRSVSIGSGFWNRRGLFYKSDGHSWTERNNVIEDPIDYPHPSSPFRGKKGVTDQDWRDEMAYLSSEERLKLIDMELENIYLGLEQTGLKRRIEQEKRKLSEMKGQEHSQDYADMRQQYNQRLERLRAAKLDRKLLKDMLSGIDAEVLKTMKDRYRMMAYVHYLLGVLQELENKVRPGVIAKAKPETIPLDKETGLPRFARNDSEMPERRFLKEINNRKGRIFTEARRIFKDKTWSLYEPLPAPLLISATSGYEMSDYFPESIDGKSYFVDTLSREKIEVPAGSILEDHIDGLILVSKMSESFPKFKRYFLRGRKVDKYIADKNIQEDRKIEDIFYVLDNAMLFYSPSMGDDWLGIGDRYGKRYYFGPAADKLEILWQGFPRTKSSLDFDVTVIRNEIVIRLRDSDNNCYFVGKPVEQFGSRISPLKLKRFEDAHMPVELSNGKVVWSVQNNDGYWEFLGDGAEHLFDRRFHLLWDDITVYSQGRWAAIVQLENLELRYVGNINDPDIESAILGTAPDTNLHSIMETPDGRLVALVPEYDSVGKRYWRYRGAWANDTKDCYGFSGNLRDLRFYREAELPVFFSKDSSEDWVVKTKHPQAKQLYNWIGSPEFIDQYNFYRGDEGSADVLIKKIYPPEFTSDNRWIAKIELVAAGEENGYIGTLLKDGIGAAIINNAPWRVDTAHLRRHRSIICAYPGNVNVVFERDAQGNIDPDRYLLVYNLLHGRYSTIAGPIVEDWDMAGTRLPDGVNFTIPDKNGNMLLLNAGNSLSNPGHNFLDRIVGLYGIDPLDLFDRRKAIPYYRIDLRWKHIDYLLRMNMQDRVRFSISPLIDYMRKNKSSRYYNRSRTEEIIRRHKRAIVEWQTGSYVTFQEFFNVLNFYGLKHMVLEIAMEADEYIFDLGEEIPKGKWRKILAQSLTSKEWQDSIYDYFQNLQKVCNLKERPVLLSPIYVNNVQDHQKIKEINELIVSSFSPEQEAEQPGYYNYNRKLFAVDEKLRALGISLPRDRLGAGELETVFEFLHRQLKDNVRFEAEISEETRGHPVSVILRHFRRFPSFFKVLKSDFSRETREYQERYARWQDIDEGLIEILGEDFEGFYDDTDAMWKVLLNEIGHDGPVLGFILWLLSLPAGALSKALIDRDKIIGKSGDEAVKRIWQENPWFSGKGFGEEQGAGELLAGIMSLGREFSEADIDQIREFRKGLKLQERAILDAVLLIASEPASRAMEIKRERVLLMLIPLAGGILIRDRAPFRARQKMNKALVKFVKGVEGMSLKEFYAGLQEIVRRYSSSAEAESSAQGSRREFLEPEAFRQKVLDIVKQSGKVKDGKGQVRSRGTDGSSINRKGQAGEFIGIREYQQHDPLHQINWSATGRSGKVMVNETLAQAVVPTGILLDMRRLGREDDIWIRDLVNSVKVLYANMRAGNGQMSDYQLQTLIFIMPDASVEIDGNGFGGNMKFAHLLEKVLQRVELRYQEAVEQIFYEESWKDLKLSFYGDKANSEYRRRTEIIGQSMDKVEMKKHLQSGLRRVTSRVDNNRLNVYITGLQEDRDEVTRALHPSMVYHWQNNQAHLLPVKKNRSSEKSADISKISPSISNSI